MFLQRIILSNFKNITAADIHFSPKINCILGDNGEGKTNLLDAIYYLSMTKSFLLSTDHYTYTKGAKEATLFGQYENGGGEEKISIRVLSSGEKSVKRNQKSYSRISEHIGLIPVVIIAPSDISLISDSSEERRRFMNVVLSQIDREYLRAIQSYNKILAHRNKLLKEESFSPVVMEAINAHLSKEGETVYLKRKALIEELASITEHYYAALSGGKESIAMHYTSDLNTSPLALLLEKGYDRDLMLKYTTVGVQRDDVTFLLNGRNMRKCSSQGQQKTFLIALKLAQYSLMRSLYGFAPILLLDDVFDKLDMKRVEYLIEMVAKEDFGQIFITDSNKTRIASIVSSITTENGFYHVENGVFSKMEIS